MFVCDKCENCTAIGGGDFICIAEAEPKTVISDFEPTYDYMWCEGDFLKYEERNNVYRNRRHTY